MAGRVRVYVAASLDGFIAGPDHDISWLSGPDSVCVGGASDPDVLTFQDFIADVGALLMGRGTYDVAQRLDAWAFYGGRPVLVASHRELDADAPETVRRVSGDIAGLVGQAKEAAAGKDVYVDGGNVIRQAAEADLLDELTITLAPVALGSGHSLFGGLSTYYPLDILSHHTHEGGMVQIRARPRRG